MEEGSSKKKKTDPMNVDSEEVVLIKTTFSKKDNTKEEHQNFSINHKDLNYKALTEAIRKFYPELPDSFTLQYRDDEDLITIGSDRDLEEAYKWVHSSVNGPEKNLHLFILSKQDDKNILYGITNMLMKLSLQDHKPLKESLLLISGSLWKGSCVYSDGQEFPFSLTVCIVEEFTVEGIIEWTSLKSVTKFLGVASIGKSGEIHFKFREFEAITGADEVEVPMNYKGTLEGNSIVGNVVSKEKPTFKLNFCGIRSPKEGFVGMYKRMVEKKDPNRKYNLWDNNSNDRPSLKDQQNAFKKLTKGADLWYDKHKRGELEPRGPEDPEDRRGSCINCGLPLFEKSTEEDPNKKRVVCDNYPHCEPRFDYFYLWVDFYIICPGH